MDCRIEPSILAGDVGVELGGAMPEQRDSSGLEQRSVPLKQPGAGYRLSWRVVSTLFDRERLVTGARS